MATCNAQPSGTSKVSDSTDSTATGATRVARLAHGPTWSAPERTASGPTDGRWATGHGGQFHHQQCEAVPAQASRAPCPEPSRPQAAGQEQLPGQERESDRRSSSFPDMPRWHASGSHEPVRWDALACAWTGGWALRRGPQLPGRRATGHSSLRHRVALVEYVRQGEAGEYFEARRTGKSAATAMAHATRTTRLRMAHGGSMRFLERAEDLSLFFFFFSHGTVR